MFGTFFKFAGNPFLSQTMLPQVKLFFKESNDLANATDVKKLS